MAIPELPGEAGLDLDEEFGSTHPWCGSGGQERWYGSRSARREAQRANECAAALERIAGTPHKFAELRSSRAAVHLSVEIIPSW